MLLAVMAIDLMVMVLMLSASKTAYHVLLSWNPHSADKNQLLLEIAVETSFIKSIAAGWVLLFSTVLLLVAISNILPGIVPGAMCGTGVMQATGGMGNRALAFRFAAVFMLLLRNGLEKLDRSTPSVHLTQTNAGLLLITIPLVFFAITGTFQSISALEVLKPVDCCAALYDSVRSSRDIPAAARIPDIFWIIVFLAGAAFFLIWGLRMTTASGLQTVRQFAFGLILGFIWVLLASITLVRVLSAYHYQVLHHHCPWCLFLAEHWLVGYFLFGSLAVLLFETAMAFAAALTGFKFPELQYTALARIRKAGIRMVLAVSLFLMIAGLPAVLWRLKYGVWMGG